MLILNRSHFNLNIEPIEQGAAYAVYVSVSLLFAADALACGVSEISAGTGIHGSHQHERAWICHRALQRLAEYLQRLT